MARKLGIDGQAVAYAVLEELLGESALDGVWLGGGTSQSIVAQHLIETADVEFQPRTRRLVLTFDLSEPDESPSRAYEPTSDDPIREAVQATRQD